MIPSPLPTSGSSLTYQGRVFLVRRVFVTPYGTIIEGVEVDTGKRVRFPFNPEA